jgi:hypothetical protein
MHLENYITSSEFAFASGSPLFKIEIEEIKEVHIVHLQNLLFAWL